MNEATTPSFCPATVVTRWPCSAPADEQLVGITPPSDAKSLQSKHPKKTSLGDP